MGKGLSGPPCLRLSYLQPGVRPGSPCGAPKLEDAGARAPRPQAPVHWVLRRTVSEGPWAMA